MNVFKCQTASELKDALVQAVSGDLIYLDKGTFLLGKEPVTIRNGVRLVGFSRYSTRIVVSSEIDLRDNVCAINIEPGPNQTVIQSLSISQDELRASPLSAPIGTIGKVVSGYPSIGRVYIRDFTIAGYSDCIYFKDVSGECHISDSAIISGWDTFYLSGSVSVTVGASVIDSGLEDDHPRCTQAGQILTEANMYVTECEVGFGETSKLGFVITSTGKHTVFQDVRWNNPYRHVPWTAFPPAKTPIIVSTK